MKIGRNQPCWCGSGKKYKHCHLNRQEQEPIKTWEAAQNLRKAFSSKYCSVPDNLKSSCKGNIVKAHSVSKSLNLKKIARDGHVYGFIPSFENLTKNFGILKPELVGINKASTFTGFCSYHDSRIFSPIENHEFVASKEQCFLLAYRAQAREYFTKTCSANMKDYLKEADRGRDPIEQVQLQSMAFHHSLAVEAGVRDVKIYKKKLDAILNTNDYGNINAYVINFKKVPTVFCSGGIFPENDFWGNELQDIFDLTNTPDMLTFSTIATNTGGSAVFAWINDQDSKGVCEKFIDSIKTIAPVNITSSLIKFYFEFCENVFLAPEWWESMEEYKRDSLVQRLANAASLFEERNSDCLCNDYISFDDWEWSSSQEIH